MSHWKRFIFASDLHGDMQHVPTVKRFLKFCADYKPHIRVFGGDLVDLRPLRRGAHADEKRESMRADVGAGMAFLTAFFEPDCSVKWLLKGNHDDRLDMAALSTDGPLADLAAKGLEDLHNHCRKLKVKWKPYHKRDGVLRIGHLKMLHGFFAGVFAARQHATVYGSCLHGHTHVIDEHPVPGLERRVARSVGALCQLDMDYNSRMPNTLRQAHGWGYGAIHDRTGEFFVNQAEQIGDTWNVDVL